MKKRLMQKSDSLSGFMTVEKDSIRGFRIISRVFDNRHFIILRYERPDVVLVNKCFNRLNYKHGLGETWFITDVAGNIFSLSFRMFPWLRYRSMLFEKGVDRDFCRSSLKDRFGCISVNPKNVKSDYPVGNYLYRVNESASNMELKNNLCRLLFGCKNVQEVGRR